MPNCVRNALIFEEAMIEVLASVIGFAEIPVPRSGWREGRGWSAHLRFRIGQSAVIFPLEQPA